MMIFRFQTLGLLLAAGLYCALPYPGAHAGDPSPAIPQGYLMTRYTSLWEHSPFAIASVQQQEAAAPAQDLIVVGIAKFGNDDVVTVLDKQSNERFTLDTSAPSEKGIKVVSVIPSDDPMKTRVKVQRGSEVMMLGFDRAALAAASSAAAQPGAANMATPGTPAWLIQQRQQQAAAAAAAAAANGGLPPAGRQYIRQPTIPNAAPQQ